MWHVRSLQHHCLLLFSNKEKKCSGTECTYTESVCTNKSDTKIPEDDDPGPDAEENSNISLEVQLYCSSHDRADVEAMLTKMAAVCPDLWQSLTRASPSVEIGLNHQQPRWCKCGKI